LDLGARRSRAGWGEADLWMRATRTSKPAVAFIHRSTSLQPAAFSGPRPRRHDDLTGCSSSWSSCPSWLKVGVEVWTAHCPIPSNRTCRCSDLKLSSCPCVCPG